MKAGIALGSNLGERGARIREGFDFLRTLTTGGHFLEGPVLETEPVDCPPGSPLFFNSVAEIDFAGSPRELMSALQGFERKKGRPVERATNAPRPLDLDIVYFGNETVAEADLAIPHPRAAGRLFVLKPLAAIRPDLVLPGQVKTVKQLSDELA